MEQQENYFITLNWIKCDTEVKNNLTYVSWSDSWSEVKKIYPESNYTIYENQDWFPFWESKFGIDVKVWVIIQWIEHIIRLPVMDWANKSMKLESYKFTTKYWEKTVEWATTFDINKAIQRAFTKAIAMHWIWLYVYRWEDLPDYWNEASGVIKKETKDLSKNMDDNFENEWNEMPPKVWNCSKCWAKMAVSKTSWKTYCSALCWKN